MILKKIRLNPITKLYEANEAAIKYQIDPSLLDDLKNYFNGNPYLLISNWYSSLDDSNKEKVKKTTSF